MTLYKSAMKKQVYGIILSIFLLLPISTSFGESEKIPADNNNTTIEWIDRCVDAGSISTIRVNDEIRNIDSDVVDRFDIHIWSDSDDFGINQTVNEIDSDSGIFEGIVFFSRTDNTNHRVLVSLGDTVYAEYEKNVAQLPVLELKRSKSAPIEYGPCTLSIVNYIENDNNSNKEIFYPAPLQQIKLGLHLDEIKCKKNLTLIQKYDDSPICVKLDTVSKLVEREWFSIASGQPSVYCFKNSAECNM